MFNLGQFRKNDFDKYTVPLKFNFKDISTQKDLFNFTDKAIFLSGENVVTKDNSYYLNFQVYKKTDSVQVIRIYLKNANATEDNIQELYTYTIGIGEKEEEAVPIEFIFTPNNTYNRIVFELQRESEDYTKKNKDGTYGRLMNIDITNLSTISNVLSYINHSPLTKIGIQGPPGLLMCINGEEIRIGRSGIYEITNGYKVNFIGFVVKSSSQTASERSYFILDYQY